MLDAALPASDPGATRDRPEECDVLIIGGGPAGATAAALLAGKGRHVVLLEKDTHPRFHVGESLLPRNLELIDRLNLSEIVASCGVCKPGAEFVSDAHDAPVRFSFGSGINQRFTHSWQVRRAEFDAALFAEARTRGADMREGARVTEARFTHGARALVTATTQAGPTHRFAPRYVIDASGRDTFLARRFGCKRADKRNNTAAVFAHFRNAECRTGEWEGYLTVHLVNDGWFWMIPLPDGIMSVGFVGTQAAFKKRSGPMEAFLADRIRQSPSVAARMGCAERVTDVVATGNYSYRASHAAGDGYLMIGDAFAFLDPIFSSGVLLAMIGGDLAADVADAWLTDRRAGQRLARRAERNLCRALDTLEWMVCRINHPVMRDMFMSPSNRFRMRDGLVSLLAGHVQGDLPRLPVLAFKAAFHTLAALARFGLRLHQDGTVRRTAPPR